MIRNPACGWLTALLLKCWKARIHLQRSVPIQPKFWSQNGTERRHIYFINIYLFIYFLLSFLSLFAESGISIWVLFVLSPTSRIERMSARIFREHALAFWCLGGSAKIEFRRLLVLLHFLSKCFYSHQCAQRRRLFSEVFGSFLNLDYLSLYSARVRGKRTFPIRQFHTMRDNNRATQTAAT